ncbi:hypothetical protein RRG08_009400 [Elysia crispata]|uniref:Uncharacterized protein n=1 Tax=Elysia crispata TaxID=231223 RepID=A0AAE1ABW0_9GAST|nr:hypothetical protein RRG08_009400 [Elysia crispata]
MSFNLNISRTFRRGWRYQNRTYPLLNVELFLAEDIPNKRLRSSAYSLEKSMLPNVAGQPHILSVEFPNHSIHDVLACGGVECYGICKTRFSGGDFCSCWPGQIGSGCSIFDCRKDTTDFFPTQSFCQNGQCALDTMGQAFECDCNPGYYGDRCDVNVCDMSVNACGSHGKCAGLVEEGNLCFCEQGWGGIFCEKQTTEDNLMTTCEKERRLMLFVHGQVTGQVQRSSRFSTFMSVLLYRIESDRRYSVPFCSHSDPGSSMDRQYMSVCFYDSNTGNHVYCECVDENKKPNDMVHYGEGDCRDSTETFPKTEAFFIHHSNNASASALYVALSREIEMRLRGIGGRLKEIDLNTTGKGCTVVEVSWSSPLQTRVTVVDLLLNSRILVNEESVQISRDVCKTEANIDSCPTLLPNHMELIINCEDTCSEDEDCGEESKCCKSGCGAKTCTEVGFRDKITANITVDMEWNPQLGNASNIVYIATKTKIEANLDAEMRRRGLRSFISSKVLTFYPVELNQESATRAKRQAQIFLGIVIELKFNNTLPVESLLNAQSELEENGLPVEGQVYRLWRIQIGRIEEDLEMGEKFVRCGFHRCDSSSLCVESIGGIEYCACPEGRSGPSCSVMDCVTSEGSELCQNGGRCIRNGNDHNGGHCGCRAGFFGQFCQERFCDHLTDNACGLGRCLGIISTSAFCRCPRDRGGLFCELDRADPRTMTACKRSKRMFDYVVNLWKGLSNDTRIKDIDSFVNILGYMGHISVPHCWPEDSVKNGAFHSMCQYNMETKMIDSCHCLDDEGNQNYWDYDYETRQCRIYSGDCNGIVCHNGGSCISMPGEKGYCACPDGYHGLRCEIQKEVKCPGGAMPLMAGEEEFQCRMAPCPYGFQCNAHSADRWTACCFDEGFLCKTNPCQGGGSCVGNIMTGQVCDCPTGRGGMLCENFESDGEQTPCQISQRFKDAIIVTLTDGTSPLPGLSVENLRRILLHNKMEWIPQASCDVEGHYKSTTQAVHILNTATTKEVCLDTSGVPDPSCRAATCQLLSVNGEMTVCENGGRCVGDVRQKLCDCAGTGYHGFRCHLPGRSSNETTCTLGRDIAQYALSVLYDDDQPEILREQMNKVIDIHGDEDAGVFVPSCDVYGKFEFRGCVHPRQPEGTPTCYCATADGQIVGDKVSLMQLPEGCDGGKPHGNGTTEHCPAEWGKECIKPPWWCSHEVQCRKKERCSHLATPDGEIIECVPKETILPCDYQPCKDNPFAKCSPCGLHGKCYNAIMDHSPGRNKTMPSKSDEDDKEPGLMSNRPEGPTGSEGRTKAAVLRCSCSLGYSGEFCDVNTEVCGTVSEVLCEHGCMGDIDRGYLCRCPEGMAGIFCNKAVRSECERRKALFDDAIAIMTDEMTVEGYDNEQLKNLISLLVRLEGGDDIPKLNCTNTGLYAKIQCQYNLNSDSEWCYCANQQGEYISSNVQSYIDFDVCTANGDLRGLNEYYCHEDNPLGQSLCLNNGTCLFDVYNGHVCECPDGYSGAFCETLGDSTEARSLCEFMASAFDSLHVLNVQLAGQVSKSQMAAIMNITSSFIFPHKDNQYSVRPDCTQEGGFASSAVCYYNIRTKEKAACFCWGANGPDFYRPVAPGDDPFTKCASPMHCRDMIKEECPELKCMGGYRTDLSGCPVCECKHPCEDLHCKRGERCQMDPKKCHSNMAKEGKMDKDDMSKKCAMCVPIHKPGVCPDHNLNTYSSVLGGALGFSTTDEEDDSDGNDDKGDDNDSAMKEERTCRVSCRDDADCYGKKKCCGICGNRCIDPVETFTCSEEADKMNEYVVFLKEVEKALLQSQSQEEQREKLTLLDRISSVPHVWLPDCESDGHFFKPLQCEYLVDDLEDDQTPVPYRCFCVDRLGMRLPGTEGIDHNDPSACLNKPGACPYLTYGEEDGDNVMHTCASDVDCLGENKCCSDGVGMVCAPPSEKHMMATTDRLMSALCKINSTMCNGLCREDWESDGISCQCNKSSSYGPFCQQRLESGNVLPKTVCERKKLATSVFEGQFYEHETNPQGIVLLYQDYIRQMYEMVDGYDMEDEGFTMVKYECTSDGHFKPMQCIRDVLTWTDKACYCVDMNGTELIGTRKDIKEGLPHCGGDHQRMCPIGYPLHNSEGSMLKCGENVDGCPKGYACTRGAYGSQHCCLTRQGMRDVCHLPADVGMDCDAGMKGTGPGTRYFFDGKQCVSFNYKGCGGNKNHFRTKTACEERCKDKVHAGSCPARAFQVNVGKAAGTECKNHCREDKDCDATHKCCQSSCGRRCFPSISQSVERGMCPYGEPQQYCSPVVKCPAGHYCKNESIEGGICCAEYNNVNVCDLPPQHSRKCSESMPRFFYNATSMACEQFTYTGCAPQFNNFKSLEECCGACNGRGRCRPGKCPAVKPGTAISCQDECSADSSCPGKQICCSNGCAKMCALPHVDPVSDCWDRKNAALKRENVAKGSQSKHCNAVDIPECERSGNWSSQQCHKAFGLCWCVTPKGNFINNTMTHGPASCDSFTALEITRADQLQVDPATARLEVCPPSETLHCCPRSLCERSCRRYPRATCRINPCWGCNAEYFVDGQQVDCSEGLSKCEKELKEAATTLQEHQITIRSMKMAENDEGMYDEDSNDEEETPSYRPRSIQPGIPLRCQLPPSTGPCKGYSKRWYYNPTMGACNMFVWGMCQGNQNRFDSPAECYNTCNEKADPCKNVTCSAGQECQHKYDKNCHSCAVTAICAVTISPNHASGVYIPRCEQDGDYNHMQCHDQYCWCVDKNGDYLNGLTTEKLRLRCAANGMTADSVVKTEDCRNGRKPNISCIKECTRQVCPGNPEATCKVDLCSDNCAVTFVDEDNAEVDCQGNKCDVFKFDQEDREECSAKLECNGTTVRHCPESLCQNAQKSCSKNPCAVCNIDPCTCRPYFVDSITGERLSQDQCDYISLGVCQAKTCSLLNRRAAARLSGESATTSVPLPECDQEGNFIPKQCNGEDCVCVNEFGSPVGSPTDGTCQEIDEVVKVQVTLSFEGSLSDLNSEYKIQDFKNAILARLEEFGINPKNVRLGEPSEGSIKIDIEIIENPSSTQQRRQNIALASNALKQAVDSGNFDIEVDGQSFSLNPAETVVSPQTASQVGTGGGTTTSTSTTARPIDTDDDSGLTDTDKIIIGAVCGGVGLLVLIIICYCICSRSRKKETPPDDTYDHIRAGGDRDSNYVKPALYNPTFEDNGHYMKVRM